MVTKSKKKTAPKPVYRKVRYYQVSGYFYEKVFLFFRSRKFYNYIVRAKNADEAFDFAWEANKNRIDRYVADVEFIEEVEELVPPLLERFFNTK